MLFAACASRILGTARTSDQGAPVSEGGTLAPSLGHSPAGDPPLFNHSSGRAQVYYQAGGPALYHNTTVYKFWKLPFLMDKMG